MSREERRNYERMMRNVERGPALPPAARARAERNAARRAARRPTRPTRAGSFTPRVVIIAVVAAFALGYGAFSIAWPNMPLAAYLGVGVGALALAVVAGFRLVQRRLTPP